MRKVMLLALLALALTLASPTASLANTVGFSFDTCPGGCTTLTGSFVGPSDNPTYTLTGSGVTFTIGLTGLNCPNVMCSITGGSVTVTNDATGAVEMTSTLTGAGRIIRSESNGVVSDVFNNLDLTPSTGGGQVAFGTLNGTVNWDLNTGDVISGRMTSMGATNVPEPGMLGMLASGMIGFAGMAGRRLKSGHKSRI